MSGTTPVGIIDFDYAAPVDRLFDLAYAARHWVPFRATGGLDPAIQGIDQIERFARLVDVHRLTRAERARLVAIAGLLLDRLLTVIKERADAGIGGRFGSRGFCCGGFAWRRGRRSRRTCRQQQRQHDGK